MRKSSLNKGFTLIELIIVVAIIGLIAAAAFVAIDPAKRIGNANNAQRWEDITAIVDAIMKYTVDNSGTMPPGVADDLTSNSPTVIDVKGGDEDGTNDCTWASGTTVDISSGLVPNYLATMPLDPGATGADETEYFIVYDSSAGRVRVAACDTYDSASIYVQR